MDELKQQALSGILWRGGYQAFQQLAALAAKVVLVRLLVPEDFGILAMALIVFTSLDILNRFAGGEPFIRDNVSDQYKARNTLFYINLLFLTTTATISFLSAPYVALFFANKISNAHSIKTLVWIIRIFSLRLFLSILAAVPIAVLTKELKFNKLYISNIAGTFAYALTAPFLALIGFGIWSIIIASILEQVIITALFLYYKPFLPSLLFDTSIAKQYVKYNSNIFAIAAILIILTNGDDTIIGRLMGPVTLGFYNIGEQFARLAAVVFITNINSIIFPVLSKVQHDEAMFTRAFYKSFRLTNLAVIPCIGASIILAKPIVFFFLGSKWLPMLPVFYIFSIYTVLTSVISIADPVFNSLNMPHIIRNSFSLQLTVFLFLLYPLAKVWGHLGVSMVMVVVALVNLCYLAPKMNTRFPLFYRRMFTILSKIMISTAIMMFVIYVIKNAVIMTPALTILLVLLGVVTYFLSLIILDDRFLPDIQDVVNMVKTQIDMKYRTV